VAIAVKDTPPAELTACPVAPEGFPVDQLAVMPAPVRRAAIRLATAYRQVTDQLDRLITWSSPKTPCPPPDAQAR
jgi:hypothetical protein